MASEREPPEESEFDALTPDEVHIEAIEAFHLGGNRFSASFELSDEYSEVVRSFLLDIRFEQELTFDVRLQIEDSILSHSSLSPGHHLVLELGGIIHELQSGGDSQVTLQEGMLRRVQSLDVSTHFVFGKEGICYIRTDDTWDMLEPYGDSYFKDLHGRSKIGVYACGSRGELVRMNGRSWTPIDLAVGDEFNGILVAENGSILLAGFNGACFEVRDEELISLENEGHDFIDIAEFKGRRFWSDANFGVSVQDGDRIVPFRAIEQGFVMHASSDFLVIAGWKEVFVFDGENWDGFELGYDGNIFLRRLEMTNFGG